MQMYEVGGCVRDEILGAPSKDIDFTVVLDKAERTEIEFSGESPFDFMVKRLIGMQYDIKVLSPQFLTARAVFPKGHKYRGGADFVLSRKEGEYSDGRRPDKVEPGTLMDDLARRDFTMNAIAKDEAGNLIDPFGGQQDIADGLIVCVRNPWERIIAEDALRGLRAIRFAVTKGFTIDESVRQVLADYLFRNALRNISTERIQGELDKAFKVDTPRTLGLLNQFSLVDTIFGRDRLHLVTSMKGK